MSRSRFIGAPTAPPGYRQITSWGALQDPSSHTDTGTAEADGVCTFVMLDEAGAYLGHQTDAPGYELHLRSIPGLASYDPTLHELEFYVELLTWSPEDYNARYSPVLSIVDDDYAGRATAVGIGYGVRATSTTLTGCINVGPTSALGSAGTGQASPAGSFTCRFTGLRGAADVRLETAGSVFNGTTSLGALGQRSSPMSVDPDNYYLQMRVHKSDANGATPTIQARVWYRRLARSGLHPT